MDHQDTLRLAVDALGTKPHPLRFFRADRPIFDPAKHGRTSRAHVALGSLAFAGVVDGELVTPVGVGTARFEILTRAFSAVCAKPVKGTPRDTIRAMVIAGHGTARALVFSDASVLFAHEDTATRKLRVWPGIAWLRAEGPRRVQGEDTWGVAVKVGKGHTQPRLILSDVGAARADRGCQYGPHTTWDKHPVAPMPKGDQMLDRLRTAIDHIGAGLSQPAGLIQGERHRGTHWPLWMPYTREPTNRHASLINEASPALLWLAMTMPDAQRVSLEAPHQHISRTGWWPDNMPDTTFVQVKVVAKNGAEILRPLKHILAHVLPDGVVALLRRLEDCTHGLVFSPYADERIPRLGPPVFPKTSTLHIPDSAHARMALISQFGAPVDWTNWKIANPA